MHLLNTLPQRLDPGATPTFAGLIAPSLTSPAATNLTLGTGTYGTALTVASATGAVTATTTLADQGGTIAAQRNGLAPAQGLVQDGTYGSAVVVPAQGLGDFAYFQYVNPTDYSGINGIFSGNTNSFAFYLLTSTGFLNVDKRGVFGVGASTTAVPTGVWSLVGYSRTGGTTGTFWLNGVALNSVTDTQTYSGASSFVGAINPSTQNPFRGGLGRPMYFNRALSAAEVLALYQSGAVAALDYNEASQLTNGTFGNGVAPYTTFSGASATGFTAAISSATSATAASALNKTTTLRAGQSVRVTVNVSFVTGSAITAYLHSGAYGAGDARSNVVSLASGSNTVVLTANTLPAPTHLVIGNNPFSTATSVVISGVTITPLGALLAPDSNNAGAGLEWLDVSGNRAHIILPTSGVSWSLPSSQQIVIEASTSTNGNQQLGGASLIDANKQWRIQSWTVNCSTGTPTISLGNVSAGAQYVSGAVMAAGNNDITLVTRFPSTANLWVNSSTTATLIHRITLVPAN